MAKYIHYPVQSGRSGGGLGNSWNTGSGTGSSSSSSSSLAAMDNAAGTSHVIRTYYPGRTSSTSSIQSPMGGGVPVGMAGDQLPSSLLSPSLSWKQQQQQQQFHGSSRRVAPPSSLLPRAIGNSNGASRSIGNTPLGTSRGGSLFGGSHTPISTSSSIDEKSWPDSLSITPSSAGVISSSVWGSNSLTTPDDSQHQWGAGKDEVSKLWNQTSASDTPSKPPGLSVNSDPPSSLTYMPPSHAANHSSSLSGETPADSFPSFGPGSTMWGHERDEHKISSQVPRTVEPTFAEWQAGVKAPLPTFKLSPDLPTSPWLVIKNINKNVRKEGEGGVGKRGRGMREGERGRGRRREGRREGGSVMKDLTCFISSSKLTFPIIAICRLTLSP